MTQTLTPGADKARLTASGFDEKNNVAAPLPAVPVFTSGNPAVVAVFPVDGHPEQQLVFPVAAGTADVTVTCADLPPVVLSFEVPEVVVVPVATKLVVDSQTEPQ